MGMIDHVTVETQEGDNLYVWQEITDSFGVTQKSPSYLVPTADDYQLIGDIQYVGNIFGNLLADKLTDDDVLKGLAYKAVIGTIVEHFGSFVGYLGVGGTFDAALDFAKGLYVPDPSIPQARLDTPEISETFTTKLASLSAALLADVIVDEVGDVLGLEGTIAGEVFDVAAGTVTTGFVTTGMGFLVDDLSANVYSQLVNGSFSFDAPLKNAAGEVIKDASGNVVTVGDRSKYFNYFSRGW